MLKLWWPLLVVACVVGVGGRSMAGVISSVRLRPLFNSKLWAVGWGNTRQTGGMDGFFHTQFSSLGVEKLWAACGGEPEKKLIPEFCLYVIILVFVCWSSGWAGRVCRSHCGVGADLTTLVNNEWKCANAHVPCTSF